MALVNDVKQLIKININGEFGDSKIFAGDITNYFKILLESEVFEHNTANGILKLAISSPEKLSDLQLKTLAQQIVFNELILSDEQKTQAICPICLDSGFFDWDTMFYDVENNMCPDCNYKINQK